MKSIFWVFRKKETYLHKRDHAGLIHRPDSWSNFWKSLTKVSSQEQPFKVAYTYYELVNKFKIKDNKIKVTGI